MKLLHFGLFNNNEPQQALRDALKGICTEYYEHSFIAHPDKGGMDFVQLLKIKKPDVVFMQIQTPGIITGSLLSKYPSIKFFNFNGDVREVIHPWHFDVAHYCTTLFSNTDWVDIFLKKGFAARYFQIGFDHNIYKPEGIKVKTSPVVFLGNNHGQSFPLSKLRGDMVERFKNKEWFQVYGRGWGDGVQDLNYKQITEASVYRGAKIGINLSHMDLGSYTSDRMFRLMGCGAMCLAYKHKDIEKEFTDQKNLLVWQTLNELESLIDYLLRNKDISNRIGQEGCKLVHEKYTWPARLQADLIPLL